jgi:hypothetical protein
MDKYMWETMWSVSWFDMWWVIDLPWSEFESRSFRWFYHYPILVWRIVFAFHRAHGDEEHMFLGWVLKPRLTVYQWFSFKTTGTVCQWFGLKTTGMASPSLASKPVVTVSPGLASKPMVLGSLVWASKPAATVWWFGPQIHHDSFLVWSSKLSGLWFVGCTTKPMGWWRRRGTRVEI